MSSPCLEGEHNPDHGGGQSAHIHTRPEPSTSADSGLKSSVSPTSHGSPYSKEQDSTNPCVSSFSLLRTNKHLTDLPLSPENDMHDLSLTSCDSGGEVSSAKHTSNGSSYLNDQGRTDSCVSSSPLSCPPQHLSNSSLSPENVKSSLSLNADSGLEESSVLLSFRSPSIASGSNSAPGSLDSRPLEYRTSGASTSATDSEPSFGGDSDRGEVQEEYSSVTRVSPLESQPARHSPVHAAHLHGDDSYTLETCPDSPESVTCSQACNTSFKASSPGSPTPESVAMDHSTEGSLVSEVYRHALDPSLSGCEQSHCFPRIIETGQSTDSYSLLKSDFPKNGPNIKGSLAPKNVLLNTKDHQNVPDPSFARLLWPSSLKGDTLSTVDANGLGNVHLPLEFASEMSREESPSFRDQPLVAPQLPSTPTPETNSAVKVRQHVPKLSPVSSPQHILFKQDYCTSSACQPHSQETCAEMSPQNHNPFYYSSKFPDRPIPQLSAFSDAKKYAQSPQLSAFSDAKKNAQSPQLSAFSDAKKYAQSPQLSAFSDAKKYAQSPQLSAFSDAKKYAQSPQSSYSLQNKNTLLGAHSVQATVPVYNLPGHHQLPPTLSTSSAFASARDEQPDPHDASEVLRVEQKPRFVAGLYAECSDAVLQTPGRMHHSTGHQDPFLDCSAKAVTSKKEPQAGPNYPTDTTQAALNDTLNTQRHSCPNTPNTVQGQYEGCYVSLKQDFPALADALNQPPGTVSTSEYGGDRPVQPFLHSTAHPQMNSQTGRSFYQRTSYTCKDRGFVPTRYYPLLQYPLMRNQFVTLCNSGPHYHAQKDLQHVFQRQPFYHTEDLLQAGMDISPLHEQWPPASTFYQRNTALTSTYACHATSSESHATRVPHQHKSSEVGHLYISHSEVLPASVLAKTRDNQQPHRVRDRMMNTANKTCSSEQTPGKHFTKVREEPQHVQRKSPLCKKHRWATKMSDARPQNSSGQRGAYTRLMDSPSQLQQEYPEVSVSDGWLWGCIEPEISSSSAQLHCEETRPFQCDISPKIKRLISTDKIKREHAQVGQSRPEVDDSDDYFISSTSTAFQFSDISDRVLLYNTNQSPVVHQNQAAHDESKSNLKNTPQLRQVSNADSHHRYVVPRNKTEQEQRSHRNTPVLPDFTTLVSSLSKSKRQQTTSEEQRKPSESDAKCSYFESEQPKHRIPYTPEDAENMQHARHGGEASLQSLHPTESTEQISCSRDSSTSAFSLEEHGSTLLSTDSTRPFESIEFLPQTANFDETTHNPSVAEHRDVTMLSTETSDQWLALKADRVKLFNLKTSGNYSESRDETDNKELRGGQVPENKKAVVVNSEKKNVSRTKQKGQEASGEEFRLMPSPNILFAEKTHEKGSRKVPNKLLSDVSLGYCPTERHLSSTSFPRHQASSTDGKSQISQLHGGIQKQSPARPVNQHSLLRGTKQPLTPNTFTQGQAQDSFFGQQPLSEDLRTGQSSSSYAVYWRPFSSGNLQDLLEASSYIDMKEKQVLGENQELVQTLDTHCPETAHPSTQSSNTKLLGIHSFSTPPHSLSRASLSRPPRKRNADVPGKSPQNELVEDLRGEIVPGKVLSATSQELTTLLHGPCKVSKRDSRHVTAKDCANVPKATTSRSRNDNFTVAFSNLTPTYTSEFDCQQAVWGSEPVVPKRTLDCFSSPCEEPGNVCGLQYSSQKPGYTVCSWTSGNIEQNRKLVNRSLSPYTACEGVPGRISTGLPVLRRPAETRAKCASRSLATETKKASEVLSMILQAAEDSDDTRSIDSTVPFSTTLNQPMSSLVQPTHLNVWTGQPIARSSTSANNPNTVAVDGVRWPGITGAAALEDRRDDDEERLIYCSPNIIRPTDTTTAVRRAQIQKEQSRLVNDEAQLKKILLSYKGTPPEGAQDLGGPTRVTVLKSKVKGLSGMRITTEAEQKKLTTPILKRCEKVYMHPI